MKTPMKTLRVAVACAIAGIGISALSPTVDAAGLGRLSVNSTLGQPLLAEIELVSLAPGEFEAIMARVASPESYQNARIEYQSVLRQLRFSVERKASGQAFLKVTSLVPINEPFIDLLVEMSWPTGRLQREYPILLDPPGFQEARVQPPVATVTLPPAPAVVTPVAPPVAPTAQPVAPVAPAAQPSTARPTSVPGDTYGPVKSGDTLFKIAQQVKPQTVSIEQMLTALYRENPAAFSGNNMNRLRAGQILRVPSADQTSRVTQAEAQREIRVQVTNWNAYRQNLATGVAAAPARTDTPVAAGRIAGATPEKAPPSATESRDVLKIAKSDAKGTPGSAAAKAQEDLIAREKALKETNARTAELERQLSEMRKLAEMKQVDIAKAKAKLDSDKAAADKKVADAKAAADKKLADAKAAEDAKKAADAKKVADAKAAEDARKAADAKKIADMKAAEDAKKAANDAKAAEAKKLADAKAAEEAKKVADAKAADDVKKAAEKAVADAKVAAESKAAADAKMAADTKAAEDKKLADAKAAEDAKKAAKPADAPKPPEAPKVAEAPKPAPKPIEAPKPAEKSFTDEVVEALGNPFAWAIGGGSVLAVLGGLFFVSRKRRTKEETTGPVSNLTSAFPSDLKETTVTGKTAGGLVDTGNSSFLTDFDKTGPGTIDTDEVDPVAEAEVYIAYGRDAQAEEILKEAWGRDKKRTEIPMKLLEIYHSRKSAPAFESVARELQASVGDASPAWSKAAAMGIQIDPTNPLYAAGASASAMLAASMADTVTKRPDLDFDIGGGQASAAQADVSLDFDIGGGGTDVVDLGATQKSTTTSSGLDFDLDLGSPAPTPPPPAASASNAGKAAPQVAPEADKPVFDFDLSSLEFSSDKTMPRPKPAADLSSPPGYDPVSTLALPARPDLNQGRAQPDFERTYVNTPAPSMPDIDLNAEAPADDAVSTKIELARAYLEIGDKDGAREILAEVLREGSSGQKAEANAIIATL
jgi:pilus assembly protein FimV